MLTQEHRYKFHCPIRHPSRDITKIDSIYKSSVFDQKMGKMAFLRCPAQFYGFRSEKLTSYLDRKCQQTEIRPFSFFSLEDKLSSLLSFFRIVTSFISLGQKQQLKKPAFSLWAGAWWNIVSENHTQIRQIGRSMANLSLWQWLGWPSS